MSSSHSIDDPSVSGSDDDSLTVASSQESLVTGDEAAADISDISDDAPSVKTVSGGGGRKNDAPPPASAAEHRGGVDCDHVGPLTVALSEERLTTGDAKRAVDAAAVSKDCVDNGDGDDSLAILTEPDGTIVAGGGDYTSAPGEGKPGGIWAQDLHKASSEERRLLDEACASEESFSAAERDVTDTASSDELLMGTSAAASFHAEEQQAHRRMATRNAAAMPLR